MISCPIYDKNGVVKNAVIDTLELHDEWMAECYVTASVKSPVPIDFEVGDYILYRGEQYTIQYSPNLLKKAASGSYQEGFVYDNIKFVGSQDDVVRCDFNDIVLNDNEMHYTALSTFPFYCETVDDLLDRIQANLEDLYPGQWIIIGLNTVRNYQRGTAVGRASAFDEAYRTYIDPAGTAKTDPYGKQGVAESVDNITCWDAMKKVHDDFDLNFIVRGRVIVVGTAGVYTPNTFRYGRGNGLYEIERVGESDQQIITRLRAYGSSANLPQHYYATLNKQVYATITTIKNKFSTTGADFLLDLDFDKKYFTYRSESYPGTTDAPNYIIEMMANDVTVRGYVTKDAETGKCYVYCEYTGGDDDRDEPDSTKMAAFVQALTANDRLYFADYVNKDSFGDGHYDYAANHLPDNMAVSRLMLPGFPTMSLNAWVQAHKNDPDKTWLAQAIADGFTFSTELYRPYIDSPNKNQFGVRPGSIYFDGSDETDDIHPTIEGMSYNNAPIDEVYAADQVEDNGVYPAGDDVKNINITLPDLGFDLDKYYEEGASIDMKNGMCGARSFKIANKPTKDANNRWVCNVERVHDESLDLWFPYCDFQIHGSSEVGHDHGDKYVLTGIEMPDAYIASASIKLLQASIEALKKNHAPRFTFQPRIDEIWMQRQHDTATSSQGVVSLHDTLKAGDIFSFADTDLNIDENVIIDVLTIRENGNNGIPTYDITLRDEKEVSPIQKITNKVDSIISGSTNINGATGGLTVQQIRSIINNFGGAQFLSKLNDDTAQGFITMLKGLQVGNQFVSGLLGDGGVFRMDADGKVYIEADKLYVRMKAYFDNVEIKDYEHTSGNRIASKAGLKCVKVEAYNSDDELIEENPQTEPAGTAYYRLYFRAKDGDDTIDNNFVVGDQAFCDKTTFDNNVLAHHRYWRLVVGKNSTLQDDEEFGYIDLSASDKESGSAVPLAGDDVSQLGNRTDVERQGAIIEFVGGENAPAYQIYQGINNYSLSSKCKIDIGFDSQTGLARMNVAGNFRFGSPDNTGSYIKYDSQANQGQGQLDIKAHVEFTNSDQELDNFVQSHQRDDSYDDTEVRGLIDGLQDQIDGQIESWFYNYAPVAVDSQGAPTSNVPSNVEPYKSWNDADVAAGNDAQKIVHLGDTFTNNKTGYCWRFTRNSSTNAFEWTIIQDSAVITALQNAARAQDTADGKRRVFLSQPVPPYDAGDMWVNAVYPANYTGATDEANHNYNNDILKCVTAKTSDGSFSINDWRLASKYTDDSKFNGYISALLNNTGLSGDSAAAAVQNAILGALGVGTVVAGGLLLTSLIGMRQYNGSGDKSDVSNYTTWAGISGQYNANVLGGGMAAWYGGGMLDKETLTDSQISQGWSALRWAKGVDRFDGSGYRADGNISWNANGALTIKNITTLSDSNNNNILNELATFNSAFTFGTSGQGSTTALYITPQVPFEELYIGTSNADKQEVATKNWVNQNFVTTTFFDNLFRVYNGAESAANKIAVNGTLPTDKTNLNIEAMFGFWTKKYISALGQGDDGSTSYTTLAQLNDVNLSNPTANQVLTYNGTHWVNSSISLGSQTLAGLTDVTITSPAANQMLGYDATTQMWKNIAIPATGVTSVALSMPTGFSITGSPITASGTFTVTFASGYSLPTTAKQGNWDTAYGWGNHANAGYALAADLGTASSHAHSDYLTSLSWDSTNKKLAWAKGGTAQTAITIGYASVAGSVAWSAVTGTPTTIADYGITDAKIANGVITLGANSITPVTTLYTLSVYGGTTKVLDFKPNNNASLYIKASGDISLTNDTTNKYITLSYSHPTNGADTSIAAADGRVLSAITVNSLGHVTSVSYKALAAADIPDLSSTYSTSTRVSTLEGYFTNGVAKKAAQLNTSHSLWGNSFNGTADINGNIVMNSANGTYIQIGAIRIVYDLANNALKVVKSDGTTAANFYATGGISALGMNEEESHVIGVLNDLNDVNITNAVANQILVYDGTHWRNQNQQSVYELPMATTTTLGGIMLGYAASGKNYALQLDANGKAYVNVPWSDTTYTLVGLIGSTAIGSTTQPIYWDGSAFKKTTYTLGKSVPSTAVFTDTWIAWVGATSTAAGTAGYMPAPTSAQRNQFLRGDGTWVDLNNYSLPTASAGTLGGVKVGTTLAISSGVLNLPTTGVTAGTYKRVTVDAYGRVTSGDNTDIDTNTWRNIYVDGTSEVGTGIDTKAINFKAGSNVAISYVAAGTGSGKSGNANYFDIVISATDTTYSVATQSVAGLMSATDKTKLDGIATGANNYSLPLATSGTRGGVKIGYSETNSGSDTTRNYAVQLSSEKMFVNVPWVNTWRGIQDNLTSTSTTDSLSAAQGKALKGYIDTLNGYFSSGVAKSAAKLTTVSKTAWGQTFWTSSGVPDSISGALSSVTNITMSGYIKIGDAYLSYDSTNNAIRVSANANGTGAVNFYAVGGVSALGETADGQAGVGDVTWALLADGTDTRQIALSHLTTSLTTITGGTTDTTNKRYAVYKNSSNQLFVDVPWTAGSGTVTSVKVGTTSYTPTNGVISLPAYPTVPTKVSQLTNDSGYITSYTNTWRNIYVSGTEKLTTAITTKGLNFAAGSNVSLSFTAAGSGTGQNANYGTITISATDTTYESKAAASGGTAVSLVTTGEKYTWNSKAAGDHTHTTTIATSTGTNQLTLAFGSKYAITAGGTSYVFTMPSNPNTNTTYKFTIGSTTKGDATNGVDLGTLKSETAANGGTTLSLVTTGEKYSWNNKTYTTSIATDSGTNQLTLAFGTKYKLTAGGTSYIFTMPANPNTDHYDWSDITNKPLTLTKNTTGFSISGGATTSKTLTVSESYTLGAACAKGVTDNSSNADVTSTDTNLITGRTLYYQLAKKGYTTNTGTVTSVATGTGLTGGTITTSGTISINSTYQTYISHGESAYGWGNHANAGYVTTAGTQTISGLKTITAGLTVSGRVYGSGDDEGIVITRASTNYATICLGSASGIRSMITLTPNNKTYWRYNDGNSDYDIYHPEKNGTIALVSDLSSYVPLSGGTMTGKLQVDAPIVGYNYSQQHGNAAAFIFDKSGSNWTGIGANGEADTIYFSACGSEGAWVHNYKQIWKFNGNIKADKVQIGSIELQYDSTNNAIKVVKSDGTAASLYATGGVSALGSGSESGGGGDVTWALLASEATGGRTIHSSYISSTLSNYATVSSLGGYLKTTAYQSVYNVNSIYNAGLYMCSGGSSNMPHGSQYGVVLCLPYRQAYSNPKPDFGVQIELPNGDDSTYPNSMFYRTSTGSSWNSWQRVQNVSMSDVRLKTILSNPTFGIEQIANAPIIRYKWSKEGYGDKKVHIGSTAQYWMNVSREFVEEEFGGYYSLQYGVAALISAITIARKVMTHEEKIALLETRVSALEKENGEQEQLINSLQEELAKFKAA